VQEFAVPETVDRATTLEIQVAEETRGSLSQGATGGDARTLELTCFSWATTTGLDADSEDDEEAAARHTSERGMTWARRAFDELILPATLVSFLVKNSFFFILRSSQALPVVSILSVIDTRVFGSEPRPAGDAACRSSSCGSQCRGERDIRAGVP
jgi:hypothetical protein